MAAARSSFSHQISPQYSAKCLKDRRKNQLRASLASNGSVSLRTSVLSAASINTLPDLETSVFKKEKITLAGCSEYIVRGGGDLLPLVNDAFKEIKQIGFIGFGSQLPTLAQYLRDSLAEAKSDIVVKIGLRKSSQSCAEAHAAGFTEENGTLGHMSEIIAGSDLVLLHLYRSEQAANYENVFSTMKPNSILGLCNDFLYDQGGLIFPENISIISVSFKKMGQPVGLCHQGNEINFDRVYTSVSVHQDVDGRATDVVIGLSIAYGSPFTFPARKGSKLMRCLEERGFISSEIGGVQVIVESFFSKCVDSGMSEDAAYLNTVEWFTGNIAMTPSTQALLDEYNKLSLIDKERFEDVAFGSKSIVSIIEASEKELGEHLSHEKDGLPASLMGKKMISQTQTRVLGNVGERVPARPRSAAAAAGKISQTRVPPPPRSAAAAAAAGEVIQLSADSLNANGVGSTIDTNYKDSDSDPIKGDSATTELATKKRFLVLSGIEAKGLKKPTFSKMKPSVIVSLGGINTETVTSRGCNPSFAGPMVLEVLGSDTEMKLQCDISSKDWPVGCATNHLKDIKSTIGIMTLPVIRPSGRTQGELTIPYAFVNAASATAAMAETLMSGNSATSTETFYDCNEEVGSDSETHSSDIVAEDGASCEKATRIGKISKTRKWKGKLSCTRKCKDGKRIPTPPRSAAAVAPISQNPAANSSSLNASTDFGSGRSNVSELGRPAHNPSEITKWANKALEITRDWGSLVITVISQVVQSFSGCS